MVFTQINNDSRSRQGTFKPTWKHRFLLIHLFLLITNSAVAAKSDYASPAAMALSSDGRTLYIGELTAESVAVIDTTTGKIIRRIPIGRQVNGLTLAENDSKLYVACGRADGQICQIDTNKDEIVRTIPTGHTPMSPKVTTDNRLLLVCNRYKNTVSLISLEGNSSQVSIAVPREPVAAAITPDNRLAVVANHLQAGRADVDHVAAVVSLLDLTTQKKITDIGLPNGSNGLYDVCISPDGRYAYITHVLARFQLPTTHVDRGWMNTNAVSIIDVKNRKWLTTVLLDDMDLGAANPWGITCTTDGRILCVCHSGTHEVSLIDLPALHRKIEQSDDPNAIPNDLSFLYGLRRRIALSGQGPRSIVSHRQRIYIGLYFADAVDVVELNQSGATVVKTLSLGPDRSIDLIRRGEMLFHDGNLCYQKWQTCASCHSDGFMDALNWDLLNDGVGNPKNAKSLLLSHSTPPAMSSGIRDNAETAVRAGISAVQFSAVNENDASAIDAYIKSLKPIQSPYLIDGKPSASAERGRKLFNSAGCIRCHSGPYLTDKKHHAVGTGLGREANWSWDTPTLINVWKTAPYMHDGRAATIREVITTENPHDRRGRTSELTDEQINDLAEFVLSQ